jgi:hypothetical protein
LLFFTKRIGIALFICPPAFRAARQLAPIGAIFSSAGTLFIPLLRIVACPMLDLISR